LGYTGEWQDAAVGLVYLRARWYAPGVGRFIQKDPAQLGQNAYVYAEANPFGFTEPTGLCAYRPGDPPGTCRVEVGDKNLFRIALAHNIQPWEQIKAWNPELWNPTYQNYLIHIGDLVYLRPREPIPTAQGGSPLDTISGYLEGKMRSSTVACLTWWVEGEEIVYDFALIPPGRARFMYRGFGITLSTSPSLADVTDTGYAGFIWGFDPGHPAERPGTQGDTPRIFSDYEGPSIGASVGVNANLPPGFLDVFTFGVGGGVGGFKSLTSQVFGFYAYTSAGVSAGTPGVALTFSFLGTYYDGDEGSWHLYGERRNQPARGMYSAISTGEGSPVQSNPIIAIVRPSAANRVYRVLERYYAMQGLTPSR
jgi:RHS repeat-associated protein